MADTLPERQMRILARIAALAAATLGLVLVAPASPASAHVTLKASSPASGATLKAPPARIELRFTGTVAADRTTIEVTGADRQRVPVSRPAGSGSRVGVTPGTPLANGTYTVTYRTLSSDGHTVEGSYRFTLTAPAPAPTTSAGPPPTAPAPAATTPAASPTAAAPAAPADDGPGTAPLLAAVAVPVLALAGGGYLLARRRAAASHPPR